MDREDTLIGRVAKLVIDVLNNVILIPSSVNNTAREVLRVLALEKPGN